MAVYAGRQVLIKVDTNDTGGGTATWATIGQQRGGGFTRGSETADATHKDDNGAPSAVITRTPYSVSCDGALDPADSAWSHLLTTWAAKTKPWIQVNASAISGETVEAQYIITNLSYDFPENDLVAYTVELQGDGTLPTASP